MTTYNLILGSKSPRRQELLKDMGISFQIIVNEVDEIYPDSIPVEEVPEYLAQLKANSYNFENLPSNSVVITADTLVILKGKILGKPATKEEAISMLTELSGETHQVITGVCLKSATKTECFSALSHVSFRTLTKEEINHYVATFKPYDKAGAYGIQEWIGYIGIKHLEGSFYNVMGLPTQMLYTALSGF